MDCLDTFFPAKYAALLLPPPPPPLPLQPCGLSLRKLQAPRVVVFATQNPLAPAFGQNTYLTSRDIFVREDPSAIAQNQSLNLAEKQRPGESLTVETLFSSSSPSSAIAGETQSFAESSTFDLASYFRNPEKITTAHEALQMLVSGQSRPRLSEREEWLIRTLRHRREIVQELLMGAFKAVRMRPTISRAIIKSMPEFVDLVMIKAAAMKKMPEHVNAPFSYRARLYIEQAGVGKKARWLKQQKFTFSKIARLVFMVENHELLQPKIEWLKRIHVTGSDLAAALTRDPIILEKTISELNENVELLKSAGVRDDWIGWVIRRSSRVLICSKEELRERIDFYTRLGIQGDTFGRVVYNFPACLGHFSLDEMYSKVDYLKGFGLDDLTLGEIIRSKPQLIACSIEEDWKPLVKLFYFLGIDGYGLRKILKVKPSVFCLNINNNIAPKIRFLRDVGVHEEAIGDVLVKFPAFLSYSLDEKIRPVVIFLLEKAAVPINKVGKVLAQQPDLIGCNITKRLDIAVRFFIYHGFHREQVGLMVTEFPMVLRYSLSSMKPKLSFALRVMKLPVEEVVKFPRLFSYSLELRIVPRYKTLKNRGMKYGLRKMLACTDDEFIQSLGEQETSEGRHEVLEADTVDASAETNYTKDILEPRWLDASAELNSPESSYLHGAADAEDDTDEVFTEKNSSSKSWHGACNAQDIDDAFNEDSTSSDTTWHAPSAIYGYDINEQISAEVS
ncbi:hypothetical protein L7F22_015398 [Adiantum nelumboides]|nr:hypothetical protein [Adiantum nelumboides]